MSQQLSPTAARRAVDPSMRHRTAHASVLVTGPDGRPLVDAEVSVTQRRHRFLFGCIGFDFIPYANGEVADGDGGLRSSSFGGAAPQAQVEALSELWFDLFNVATLPFYWGDFEPVRGQPDTQRLLGAARWFADRGVRVKGHPLAWHTLAAPWLLDLSNAETLEAVRGRIARETTDFADVIDIWDVINEVVIMPVFAKDENGLTRLARELGRTGMVQVVFEQARAANPSATLLLNDFDMSVDYEHLVEDVLAAGVKIDALGLQSHMHQGYWGEEKTLSTLERFARFGLPLHMTESTLLSGHLMPPDVDDLNDYQVADWPSTPEGEARQADEVERHYRTLLSHPAVEAVNYWGLSDAGAWLGAPVGLVRADGTPKPSYSVLRDLIKDEWWLPPTTSRTDGAGRVEVAGFLGDYEVSTTDARGSFALDVAGPASVQVQLGEGTGEGSR